MNYPVLADNEVVLEVCPTLSGGSIINFSPRITQEARVAVWQALRDAGHRVKTCADESHPDPKFSASLSHPAVDVAILCEAALAQIADGSRVNLAVRFDLASLVVNVS